MISRTLLPRHSASAPAVLAFCLLATMSSSSLHAVEPAAPATDVPVREVVLFSSGVGYFQHQGTVKGDASADLRFKTAQINDILKSLVLNDLDGGRVGVVTYPSQDPLEKTLGSFQVDIGDNPSLGDLLNKLRGARVQLSYAGPNGAENFPGTVLGVERKQVAAAGKPDTAPLEKSFLNLITERGIRSLELDRVDNLRLEDAGLQDELNRALAAVAGARDQDKKPVNIRFNGTGERRVRLGYVVETPIWKASYRLVLPDKDAKDKRAVLQGWAIVENQTDNDWQNVRLSLVSGRPISFIQDLYQPLYVPRPTVVPELYASLRPQEYEGGQPTTPTNFEKRNEGITDGSAASRTTLKRARSGPMRDATDEMTVMSAPAMAAPAPGAPPPPPAQEPMNFSESIAPRSDAAKVGELFQYTVADVSLARQKSAMIPIINDPVEAEKVSIYNQGVLAGHPLNGARLRNTTEDKKHLLQGPVTVFSDGRYAGDARIDDVPPGQTRLLSYGVDLQMSVIPKDLESQQAVQTGKIVRGVLLVSRKYVSAKEYSADNKGDADKSLVIEHPVRAGWNLVDTPAPAEKTDKLYRFEKSVGAGKQERFTVREENVQSQSVYLMQVGAGDIQFYGKTGEIPGPVRDALTKVAARKQEIGELQRQSGEKNQQINELSNDQQRIRENIKSVERTSDYATRLLKKLDTQEGQLEKLRAEVESLRVKSEGLTKQLADELNNLNVG